MIPFRRWYNDCITVYTKGAALQHRIQLDEDFYRAIFLLQNRFHYPVDLLRYWAFSRTLSRATS